MKINQINDECKKISSSRIGEVYYAPDRPGMQDIEGDFVWRRTHKPAATIEAIRQAIIGPLIEKFGEQALKDLKIRHSRYCGCTMCPCSPGWIVKSNVISTRKLLIWLTD